MPSYGVLYSEKGQLLTPQKSYCFKQLTPCHLDQWTDQPVSKPRGNGTPPLCDVLPLYDATVLYKLWVAGSNLTPVKLFISFVCFHKCIFGANIIDFEIV